MILLKEVKEAVQEEYLSRLWSILKAYVSVKNTILSISAYAMSVLRCGFGVLRWTNAELRGFDKKT